MHATLTVEPLTIAELTAGELDALTDLVNMYRHEADPDQVWLDRDEVRRRFTSEVDFFHNERYVIWNSDHSAILGRCNVGHLAGMESNQKLADGMIYVHPDWRQRGLGRALLQVIADAMRRWDRSDLEIWTDSRMAAGAAAIARLDAKAGIKIMISELRLADLDRDLLRRWNARAVERATGYELRFLDGPYAEDVLPSIAAMMRLMNTAPKEAMEWEDIDWTPEHMRQIDVELEQSGRERWTAVAVERSSGAFCGFTFVTWSASEPHLVMQEDTAVDPAHRNRGLGRWLKAAMLERVLAERPQATRVRTGNAGSNAPMLAINRELGFAPYFEATGWWIKRDAVEAYLAAHAG